MINEIAKILPELVGGSADLATSNKTWIDGYPDFQSSTPEGRNFHFGVREHAMGAIVNGMALHGGLIPYGGTFLVFSDYMRGALRISALSKIPSIWVFTHDSIGVGEDGPTHQPIEHLASLRAIPNFMVIRPADANETREAWRVAIEHRNGPTALILTRQNLPTIDRTKFAPASGLKFGAYVLADLGDSKPSIILMASGSEVPLIIEAAQRLVNEGKSIRIVSFPSWELFRQQPEEYQEKVLPKSIQNRLAVEAAVPMGWDHWVNNRGAVIGISHFGASAPADTLFKEFGFTVENVVAKAKELLGK
jgi:transketolase